MKLVCLLLIIILSFLNHFWIMQSGWGVEASSVPIVVIGLLFSFILASIAAAISNSDS
jgi:amino acid transporter